MAKSAPPPPTGAKPSMSFGRKVLVFIILVLILSFLLDKLGVPIVHRSEQEKVLEHPHR